MSEAGVSASWDGVDDAAWDALLAAAPRCALQQGTDYGAALAARGRPVTRAVFRVGERVVALAQIVERRYLGIARVAALLRGPVWIDAAPVERLAVLGLLRARWPHWRYRFLLVQPDEPESRELAAALAAIGVRRIMTGYSTSWVDLRPEEETLRRRLDGKWRNQLGRGEESGLSVDAGQTRERLDWLLAQDAAQARRRRYLTLGGSLIGDLAAARGGEAALLLVASVGRDPVAGVLFLRHGKAATYQVGWVGEEGRERHAHNVLLWRGMAMLKRRGVAWLDLGGIETTSAAGIAHFKLGLGGGPTTLAGTFL